MKMIREFFCAAALGSSAGGREAVGWKTAAATGRQPTSHPPPPRSLPPSSTRFFFVLEMWMGRPGRGGGTPSRGVWRTNSRQRQVDNNVDDTGVTGRRKGSSRPVLPAGLSSAPVLRRSSCSHLRRSGTSQPKKEEGRQQTQPITSVPCWRRWLSTFLLDPPAAGPAAHAFTGMARPASQAPAVIWPEACRQASCECPEAPPATPPEHRRDTRLIGCSGHDSRIQGRSHGCDHIMICRCCPAPGWRCGASGISGNQLPWPAASAGHPRCAARTPP